MDLMIEKYQRYETPSNYLTIDERIVKFTGRLKWKQYIPIKSTKLRIKVFLVSDTVNGYVLNWIQRK